MSEACDELQVHGNGASEVNVFDVTNRINPDSNAMRFMNLSANEGEQVFIFANSFAHIVQYIYRCLVLYTL